MTAALFSLRASRALDCFAIGERSDAVLRTAMARNDGGGLRERLSDLSDYAGGLTRVLE
jgi:hypothetical protein